MLFCSIYCAVIAYLVLQGDLLPNIVSFIASTNSTAIWASRSFLMGICALLLVPVASAPALKSLRATSLVSLVSIYFLACIIVYKCIRANVITQIHCLKSLRQFYDSRSLNPYLTHLLLFCSISSLRFFYLLPFWVCLFSVTLICFLFISKCVDQQNEGSTR